MKTRKLVAGLILIGLSTAVGLVLCEVVLRLSLNPADYLSVTMVQDEVLGAVPSGAAGFDEWGFRNRHVPESADIVTIGDSHTYGNTATMEESWPYVLQSLSGRSVYNMGLGGYGPNQYSHLLSKAITLKPERILVGLYMGDDFENAFLITYGLDHWARLRTVPAEGAEFNIWDTSSPSPSLQKKIRVWLSGHSMTYQLAVHGPLMGRIKGALQVRNATRLYDSATSLNLPEKHILEAFLPKNLLRNLDQEGPNVREGMRITFELLREMKKACDENGVRFGVVVIPTKEFVFANYFADNPDIPLHDVIGKLIANEKLARERTFEFLAEAAIDCVDTMPSLRASVGAGIYARAAGDMHPNGNGYRLIGDAAFQTLYEGKSPGACVVPLKDEPQGHSD
jgi:hypothetical protein